MTTIPDAPHSIESETALLGSILIDPACLSDVRTIIQPSDFYILRHQHIYRAMLDVADAGAPVDLVTVSDRLEAVKYLEGVGGPHAVATLMNGVPTSVNAEFYARLVVMKAQRRALLRFADAARNYAYDEQTPYQEVAAAVERDLKAVMDRKLTAHEVRSVENIVQDHYDLIERATETGDYTPERFRLHVATLHDIVRGYIAKTVVTYAARPGVGKSSYLHNEAAHIASQLRDGRRVLLYSLEMPEMQVVDGLIASCARLNVQAIAGRKMRPDHMRMYARAAGDVARLPLDIDDKTRYWEDMTAEIRTRARAGTLSVVLIDYIGLVRTREKFRGDSAKRLQIDHVLADAKLLAMETGAVIVFAAQFNRAGDGAPSLVHLKESGGIEEHSDLVVGIDRDMTDATLYANAVQEARLIVLKNRHGPLGTAHVGYYGAFKLFVDLKRTGANEHAAD